MRANAYDGLSPEPYSSDEKQLADQLDAADKDDAEEGDLLLFRAASRA